MPMNRYSSDVPEAVWWTQQQPLMEPAQQTPPSVTVSQPNTPWANPQFYDHHRAGAASSSMFCGQNSAFSLNLNQEEDEEVLEEPLITDERERGDSMTLQPLHGENIINKNKEPMFEKPLTPSDVGKLNRLVIPKQHAEKYFPLYGGGDSVIADKGLLLSFEDESGKCWRFRYSYWNSSQSYVLTKGWSRFVKEKQLDPGDVVLFERHRLDCDRLFIGSRRRPPSAAVGHETGVAQPAAVAAGGDEWTRLFHSAHPYPAPPHGHGPLPPCQPDSLHAGAVVQSQTTPSASGNSKRLRLFGVNLECQQESEPYNPDGSSVSSQGQAHYYQYYYCTNAQPPNHQSHMDIKFPRDVHQTRYPQG